jgi:hypothetical protein
MEIPTQDTLKALLGRRLGGAVSSLAEDYLYLDKPQARHYYAGAWARLKDPTGAAVKYNDWALLRWAASRPVRPKTYCRAAASGNLPMLKALGRVDGRAVSVMAVCDAAIDGRCLAALEHLRAEYPAVFELPKFASLMFIRAARRGSIEIVRWLIAAGVVDPRAVETDKALAVFGTERLRWLNARQQEPNDTALCTAAAEGGSPAVLELFRGLGYQWGELVYDYAMSYRRLPLLLWAIDHGYDAVPDAGAGVCALAAEGGDLAALRALRRRGFGWDHRVCERAILGGHRELLGWARAAGAPYFPVAAVAAALAARGDLALLAWLDAAGLLPAEEAGGPDEGRVCAAAAKSGHLDVLRWCRGRTPPYAWGADTVRHAAEQGHLELARWAAAHGCPFAAAADTKSCARAARRGDAAALAYIRELGCPWGRGVAAAAALGGHLGLLRRIVAAGCPVDDETWDNAALRGHYAVVEWGLAQGYPMDESICASAAWGGHLDILVLLRGAGVPWDKQTTGNASMMHRVELYNWACANGCPDA